MSYSHLGHVLEPSTDAVENFDALFLLEAFASDFVFESASLANFHSDVDMLVSAEDIFLTHQKGTRVLPHLAIEFLHDGDLTEENGFKGLFTLVELTELDLLECYILLGMEVEASKHLAEAAFAQHVILIISVLALLETPLHV